jgi:hypothetical protein
METVFDFLTVGIFAGLIVLFLKRSVDDDNPVADSTEPPVDDHLWQYLVAAVGCAVANYVGNEGYPIPAVALIIATLAFIAYVLRPFPGFPPR